MPHADRATAGSRRAAAERSTTRRPRGDGRRQVALQMLVDEEEAQRTPGCASRRARTRARRWPGRRTGRRRMQAPPERPVAADQRIDDEVRPGRTMPIRPLVRTATPSRPMHHIQRRGASEARGAARSARWRARRQSARHPMSSELKWAADVPRRRREQHEAVYAADARPYQRWPQDRHCRPGRPLNATQPRLPLADAERFVCNRRHPHLQRRFSKYLRPL